MGQEYFINSQKLEDKIRQSLPSQGGAGAGFPGKAAGGNGATGGGGNTTGNGGGGGGSGYTDGSVTVVSTQSGGSEFTNAKVIVRIVT